MEDIDALTAEENTDGWQEEEELLWGVVRQETEYENGQLTGNVRYTLVGIPEDQPYLLGGTSLEPGSIGINNYTLMYTGGKELIEANTDTKKWVIQMYNGNNYEVFTGSRETSVFFSYNNENEHLEAYYFDSKTGEPTHHEVEIDKNLLED